MGFRKSSVALSALVNTCRSATVDPIVSMRWPDVSQVRRVLCSIMSLLLSATIVLNVESASAQTGDSRVNSKSGGQVESLHGSILADSFVISKSQTILATGDLEISCEREIRIEGNLIGVRDEGASGSLGGINIRLRSATAIVITGIVKTCRGADSTSPGITGGDGGSLILEAPVVRCTSGRLCGGDGGDARGVGAAGGDGGSVVVRGVLIGVGVRGGNGGTGGPGVSSKYGPGGMGGSGGSGGDAGSGQPFTS